MNVIFNKTSRLLVYVSLISLISVCTVFAAIPAEVVLGRSTIMSLKSPVIRVTLASPDIADVLLISPKQLQINGLKIGKTSLILWEEGNEKPNFYELEVKGDQATIEQQMKELSPNDNITVKFASDTVIISGTVARDQTKIKAEEIAKAFAPKVLNHIQMAEPLQVLLQVKVAQVDRTSLKNLGVKALVKAGTENVNPDRVSVFGAAGTDGSQASNVFSMMNTVAPNNLMPFSPAVELGVSYLKGGIGAKLTALVDKGYAKILAEPNLLVKSQPPIKTGVKVGASTGAGDKQTCSGDEGYACFLAGRQYPYISGYDANNRPLYGFKDVGIKLVFHAEVQENGLIKLRITPASVSSFVEGSNAGNLVTDIREVNTEVELGDSQSLVLAGLLQEEAIKTMSKIPLLGDIPILGALFRSTSDDLKEKELVFFVTPTIVKPVKTGIDTKFIAKEGEKYELPGAKPPIGMTESDLKIAPDQEKDFKWMPMGK